MNNKDNKSITYDENLLEQGANHIYEPDGAELNVDFKKNIRTRLKRIEGQVKGIENMVDKSCCCKDVLVQIAAVRAAINKVGGLILENYAKECMINSLEDKDSKENIGDLVSTLSMFLK